MAYKGLGRVPSVPDTRDKEFPIRAAVPRERPRIQSRYWWDSGWWGDQKDTPQCVAYAALHLLADGPITNRHVGRPPYIVPRTLYCETKEVDPWPGNCRDYRYEGTSVRSSMKVLQRRGWVLDYRHAFTFTEFVDGLIHVGPIVVGTDWRSDMNRPNSDGFVTPTGRSEGGHAYVANGIFLNDPGNYSAGGRVRFKNSWGRKWGRNGTFWMTLEDAWDLLLDRGEAVLPRLAMKPRTYRG